MVNNLFAGKDSMYFLYRRLVTKMKKGGLEDVMDSSRPDENEETVNTGAPKVPWGILIYDGIATVFTFIMLGVVSRSGLSYAELFQQEPYKIWLLVVGVVLMFIGLALFSRWKMKLGKERREEAIARGPIVPVEYDRTWLADAERLENWNVVSDTAVNMTFFAEQYIVVNGEKVHKDYKNYKYESQLTKVFVQDGKFCIEVPFKDVLIEIPLSEFGTGRKQECAVFHSWMQGEKADSEKYQPYQIETLGHGLFSCEYYYVPIAHEGREYSLLVPNYEMQTFKDMTGIQIDF